MADATSKKLLQLLQPDQPGDVRCAAALVLGEIGSSDAAVGQALCEVLDDANTAVRAQVVAAVGKLRIEKALPQLLTRVSEGGPEAEGAAQAAARLGTKGTRALQELMSRVPPGLRRRIAAALGTGDTASSETAAVDVLLDSDPGVVDAAVRSLIGKVPGLDQRHRRVLVDHVLELLGTKKAPRLPLASEAALVRLLAGLGDPRGEVVFWARLEPPHPAELRAAAVQALGTLPLPSARDKIRRLLACAVDTDFRVAAPALMILKGVPVSARTVSDWLPLLQAADAAVRRFAIDKLAGLDTPAVAEGLLGQLDHPDPSLGKDALNQLARLEHGREALAGALLEAATPEKAWVLARTQAPFVAEYTPALRSKLLDQACSYLEAGDRRADALLFVLREADPRGLRDRLEEWALALRKKKQYDAALVYLRLLGRDPACGEAIRFEQAACGLKVSSHDLAVDARAADPCLHQFAGLLNRHETDPIEAVEKAKWLEPEDLFYLGFHFAEGNRREKEFGGQVLRLFIRRSPRSKLAKDARSKLRSEGLE